jgi:hypothetical protein
VVRLTIENLEGRDLMAAGLLAGIEPEGPRAAVISELEEFASAAGLSVGTQSTKGSVVAGFAGDRRDVNDVYLFNVPYTYPDHWATFPSSFSGDAYDNEMGVIATTRDVNGIIAILIGLRSPTPAAARSLHGDFSSFESNVIASFQGGCNSGGACDAAARLFQTLPYMEQDNLYKQVTTALRTWAIEILPYIEQDNMFKQYSV